VTRSSAIEDYVASILAADGDVAEGEIAANLALALQGDQAWNARRHALAVRDRHGVAVFLSHVVQTVPFYRSLFAGRSSCAMPPLEDFPITSRRDLETNRDRFISDRYDDDAGVYRVLTSGSLGPRLPISYDLASSYGANYATYAAVAAAVPGLWDRLQPATQGIVLVDNSVSCQAVTLFHPGLNYTLLERFCLGRPEEDLVKGIRYLRRRCVPLLYGKPHDVLEFADMDRRTEPSGGRISAHALLVSGENLYEDQRARLEAWFGGQVYNAYMSAEGGFIGLECNYRSGLHVQQDRILLEVLAPDQTLAAEGTGELVLTNFTNWAMGLVRYRTGDRGTIRNLRCACGFCGPTLIDFPGRDEITFRIPSGETETRSLQRLFASLPIQQFQIIQRNPDDFVIRWVPDRPGLDARNIERAIRRGLRERLGDVSLAVEAVDRIAPSHGGKVRRYVRS
jgi:phenylacetate-coenzyme A ligase PaaK-like adenylate-forming protein